MLYNIYPNDIILIKIIIGKNYINYFHYKNIESCYQYMKEVYKCKISKNDVDEPKNKIRSEIALEKDEFVNYLILNYRINKDEKEIKIFGYNFVQNNKDKCEIFYNHKKSQLTEFFDLINLNNYDNDFIIIKLQGINNIINASYMFHKCSSLIKISNLYQWNTKNVIDMSYMFYECSSLIFISDISKWNTSNVTNMKAMFFKCSSLKFSHDITKWDYSKVMNKKGMFCGSLYNQSLFIKNKLNENWFPDGRNIKMENKNILLNRRDQALKNNFENNENSMRNNVDYIISKNLEIKNVIK